MDHDTNKISQELDELDSAQILRVAILVLRRAGFKVDVNQAPSVEQIKAGIVPILRLSMLTILSVALAALLDPLVSVTRYPDSQRGSFDENNPYVRNFHQFHDVIARILKMSQ